MVRASRHRRDMTMSVLLLTIVMVFILCNTARVACNLYEAYQVHIYQPIPIHDNAENVHVLHKLSVISRTCKKFLLQNASLQCKLQYVRYMQIYISDATFHI